MKHTENHSQKRNKTQVRLIGPVDNPEDHLDPNWWRQIFNAMYLKTDADMVDDEGITSKEVSLMIDSLGLQKDDFILDLACGQGRHLLELARRGFTNLFGLDRSRYLIQKAKSKAKSEMFQISFKEGDVRKLPYPTDNFDTITILGNSFGYFESTADDLRILKEVYRVLKPGGHLYMDVADGEWLKHNFVARSWEWINRKHFVCRERTLASDHERLISREVVTHVEKGVIVDQFYAERLYSKEGLTLLLKEAGFTGLTFLDEIRIETSRNQDLGMMEQRRLLTAKVVKEWSPKKPRKDQKQVTVIMGDPTLKDQVKPNAQFDEDDFNTIRELKQALSKLEGYQFNYLDNHRSLFRDLEKKRSKIDFVLNLCDEGLTNEAVKELHVPAMLEMLDIPYTGSGPQNLAYCYDKSLIRGVAREMGIPVAQAIFIKPEDHLFEVNIPFPVIAKPNLGDSSFGITQDNVAYTIEELDTAIVKTREKFGYGKPILIEEFLTGAEVTVGVIGNPPDNYEVLPIIEEDYSLLPDELPRICGYEAKWLTDSPYFKLLKSRKANLDTKTEQQMISHCISLFERLGCRDYCRFDWRLDAHGVPRLLEVNPNPGWCWDGHLAKMANFAGKDYSELLLDILRAAEMRVLVS